METGYRMGSDVQKNHLHGVPINTAHSGKQAHKWNTYSLLKHPQHRPTKKLHMVEEHVNSVLWIDITRAKRWVPWAGEWFAFYKIPCQHFATRNICIMNSTRVIMWKLIFLFDGEMPESLLTFQKISPVQPRGKKNFN